MKTEWNTANIEVMNRNRAIQGHNRFLEAHKEHYGFDWKPMELEPMPQPESASDD